MAEKDDTKGEVKPAPGQSIEEALKIALRERDDLLATEREERKKANEEAAAHRKARRAAEEAARESEEKRQRDNEKTLVEQGRFKDLYETEQRAHVQTRNALAEAEKKAATVGQEKDTIAADLARYRKQEVDRIEHRFSKLPEETRKVYADRPPEVKEALAEMYERIGGPPRAPGTPGFQPPSGLGPPGNIVTDADLEAMPQKEREKFFKSPEWRRTVEEGRYVPKGRAGPR